jgi:hypothetical protein
MKTLAIILIYLCSCGVRQFDPSGIMRGFWIVPPAAKELYPGLACYYDPINKAYCLVAWPRAPKGDYICPDALVLDKTGFRVQRRMPSFRGSSETRMTIK